MLETIAQNSARMNPDLAGADRRLQAADFQTYVCGQIPALFIFGNVYVDVQSFPSFSNVAINSQIDAANNFISNNMQYNSWRLRDIAVVQLFYQWPLFVTGLGLLVMFFGTVEISSGVSVDRKIKLVARASPI